jgi:toxin ParE1/3/4
VKLKWTKEAVKRLNEIEYFIALDNPETAAGFIDKLISAAETIPEFPEKGRIVPEMSMPEIREILYKNYRIVYLIGKNKIDILTIFEGHYLLDKNKLITLLKR